MERRLVRKASVLAGIAIAVGTASLAAAAPAPTVKSWKSAALQATIVVSGSDRTLYHYGTEKKHTVTCTGSCAKQWPPLLITNGAKPVAGAGVSASKLGTVKRPDGRLQVTYGGFALYRFAGDTTSGEVNGQGIDGIWHAVAASGAIVTTAAEPAAGTDTGTTGSPGSATVPADSGGSTTTPAPAGGGYGY